MILPLLIVLLSSADADAPRLNNGKIQGVVVNGSRGDEPIGDVEVLLRGGFDGVLEPLARTRTDMYGKFVFDDVPLDPAMVYLPGADRDGVHYPGTRIRFDLADRLAHVTVVAFDAVESPSPLIVERHDIDLTLQPDVMEISETLLVTNNSRASYVGEQVGDRPPATFRLSVPANFDRVTFDSEFYGRRFRVVDRQPVTDIPWPPGGRELKFTYRIPIEASGGTFRRPLDAPSRRVTLRVRGRNQDEASCNLARANESHAEILFASAGGELAAGHIIELQIGTLPFPWMQYTRWGSLLALAVLTTATALVLRRRDGVSLSAARSE
jgi:hypothetical protein